MGGCRCTYKNCTSRSDGKTHLFHFPVFDKVRCHEWLSKAGRYDFLNLKVSQLKNRCICQHHFTDDCFMNDKKDKLKVKAVPTLDGPFCDSTKFRDPEMPQNMLGLYPLACEVIENDEFIIDRKSNYNLLYADFLTNDITEPLKTLGDKSLINLENVSPIKDNYITEVYTHKTLNFDVNKHEDQDIIIEVPPKEEKIELPQLAFEQSIPNNSEIVNIPNTHRNKSKVRIISEKKITEPQKKIYVPASTASFEVVKPTMILNINKNKAKSNNVDIFPQSNVTKEDSTVLSNLKNNMVCDMVMMSNNNQDEQVILNNNKEEPIILDKYKEDPLMPNNTVQNPCNEENLVTVKTITEILNTNDPSKFEMKINIDETASPKKVITNQKRVSNKLNITKNIISPERAAAIDAKRKFNMRLKDIIAEELSRLEEQTGTDKDIMPTKNLTKEITSKVSKLGSQTVRSSLAKEHSLPNDNAYIVHYLEARMEKMENLLLNKIDQNSRKIMELKKTLDPPEENDNESNSKKPSPKTNLSEEAHKKQLYKEISQYLTPSCNSLIYEELFINKYDPNESDKPAPTKRRRNR